MQENWELYSTALQSKPEKLIIGDRLKTLASE